jgi:hypothetical protein
LTKVSNEDLDFLTDVATLLQDGNEYEITSPQRAAVRRYSAIYANVTSESKEKNSYASIAYGQNTETFSVATDIGT